MAQSIPEFRKTIERIQITAGARGRRRSALYFWLFSRADQLEPLIAQWTWQTIAEALGRLEIMDGSGNPPTAERCRKTWLAVRRAKGWTAAPTTPPPLPTPTNSPPMEDEDDVLLRAGDGTVLFTKRQP